MSLYFAKSDDEIYVLSTIKMYSYFSFVFSTVLEKVELLKISKVMQLLWKSLPPCKNGRKGENKFFSVLHCIKSVRIWSYSGPHFSRIFRHSEYLSVFSPNAGKCGKNADQNNSEYGHFLRGAYSTLLFSRKENIKCSEVVLVAVHCNFLISCIMIA